MKKKIFKFKRGIFQKLVISYILFTVFVFLSLVLTLLFSAVMLLGGDMDALYPYDIVDREGNITNLETITNLGGWVEELDGDYRVIRSYGEKRTEQEQYTPDELFDLISMDMTEEREYIGFLNTIRDGERYFLCIYDSDLMQVQMTVILNNGSSGNAAKWSNLATLTFLLLFLINCIFMSLYLRRKIKKPLEELTAGMEQIRAGKTGVSLEFQTEAEFEEIRDTFNVMARQLEQEKEEKAGLVKRKNQLLLELSHDIKTPIATIKSYANALEAGVVPEEKIQEYYQVIDLKADRITKLSEDMFLLLKMENADYQPQLERTDIGELLRQICAEYYAEITEAGFTFEIDIPEEACMGMADPRLFTRVISNLLLNAAKYNRTGRNIKVSLHQAGELWQIDVLDDGELIEAGLAENLFDAFVRGDQARKSDGGTGLGLAISRAIMEKHQGSIVYLQTESRNCFRVQILTKL